VKLRSALLALFVCAGSAAAGDANGQFQIVGEGAQSCSVFNDAFNKADSATTVRFAAWAHGYAAALNESVNGTYDLLGAKSLDDFMVDIAMACQADNTQTFHNAVRATLTAYFPDRVQAAP
jgi:uncharacterized membrane protein YqgA involved in biofilm formation